MAKRAGLWLGIVCAASFICAVARADERDDAGRAAIGLLDWQTAIGIYQPLADAAKPGSPEWTRYTFCLAVSEQQFQPASTSTIGTATKLYQSIIDQSQDPKFIARSMMNLGRIAELKDFSSDTVDLAGARAAYQKVIDKFPNDPIASEAALREGAAFIMEYDQPDFPKVKQGIAFLEKWMADHPKDPLASMIWQTAGDAYFMPLQDWAGALRCYEKVDALGWTDAGNQGAWYWRASQIAEALKQPQTAIKYYTKIINETPNSGKGYSAVLALKRLGAPVPSNPLFDDPATQPSQPKPAEVHP